MVETKPKQLSGDKKKLKMYLKPLLKIMMTIFRPNAK